jgi:cyclopropane fatty-acyl-phospholipid synthase-like methyltransferase
MITYPWFTPLMWVVFIGVIVWFTSVMWPFFTGSMWVPMPYSMARRMLQFANVKPGETVVDLGSGDGRVLIAAAREFDAKAIGVEIDPLRSFISQLTLRVLGLQGRAQVLRANLFDADLSQADVVTIYLLPKVYDRLIPKLRAELKPGARVVTLTYHFKDWEVYAGDEQIKVYRQPNGN